MVGIVTIDRSASRWTIVIRGKLDEDAGAAVHRAIRERVGIGETATQLLFDLREVEDYDVLGRAELTSAHRIAVSPLRRCAYVSDKARIRGLAILAISEVQDSNAHVVSTLEQGQTWLTEGRLDAAQSSLEQGMGFRRRS